MIEKKMIRHIVDMLMIIVLPLLMAFELIGRATHELSLIHIWKSK